MANAFVAAADLGNNGGTSSSLTVNYTCGSGSNRMLIVIFEADMTSDLATGVTYGGVAMTLIGKRAPGNRWLYMYALPNPASGSNSVVVSLSGTSFIFALAGDYTGMAQSGQPNALQTSNSGAFTSTNTTSVTTTVDNCWTILAHGGYDGGDSPAAGTGSTRRTFDVTFGAVGLFDSNAPITPAGSYSMTTTYPVTAAGGISHIMASFAPAVATPTIGAFQGNNPAPVLDRFGVVGY